LATALREIDMRRFAAPDLHPVADDRSAPVAGHVELGTNLSNVRAAKDPRTLAGNAEVARRASSWPARIPLQTV